MIRREWELVEGNGERVGSGKEEGRLGKDSEGVLRIRREMGVSRRARTRKKEGLRGTGKTNRVKRSRKKYEGANRDQTGHSKTKEGVRRR